MPLAIIAGLSQGILRRARRGYVPVSKAGWALETIHSRLERGGLSDCWQQVIDVADYASQDGTHIFAYHPNEDERHNFEEAIYSRHRLIWIPKFYATVYGTPDFDHYLGSLIKFENAWRNTIRPRDTGAALTLPEPSFTAKRPFKSVWKRAQRVTQDRDDILPIAHLMLNFRAFHFARGVWRDHRDLIFDGRGARHGIHIPRSRRWKFTHLVPEGFHFDVSHSRRNKRFSVRDHSGALRYFNQHANIDCHGFIH